MTLFCGRSKPSGENHPILTVLNSRLKREFKTQTGIFKGKRITVMSTELVLTY
jgi:hypothetical protein